MTQIELFAELLADVVQDLRPQVEPLTQDQLDWHPRFEGNSIGVTVWHLARGMDFLATRALRGLAAEDEIWHRAGWRDRTGYDPRGVGYGGWGVLTGYTWEDVMALPRLSAAEHLEYLGAASSELDAAVRALSDEEADRPLPHFNDGKYTYRQWIKTWYKGFQAHVGEIMAIKSALAPQRI